jgi:predicted transcriptional regulator
MEDRCETGENNEATQMRRSKLESYVDILALLTCMGPLKLTHIMYKSNFNGSVLKEYLDFLIKQGLIEERTINKTRAVFAVTQRGRTVLKHFRELTQEISAIQET